MNPKDNIFYSIYDSKIGKLTLAATDIHLIGLWIENQKYFGGPAEYPIQENNQHPLLNHAKAWLDQYFSNDKPALTELPLAPQGSNFQKQVWQQLCQIPYGQTITYGAIAKQIAKQRGLKTFSAQAVGGAVGRNPISIIIPCHRVIGTDGSLTGYAGGLDVKSWLLTHEATMPLKHIQL